jgi:hypothetical protein
MNGRRCFVFSILLASCTVFVAQMPDWKFFRDREGNTYFFDQGGKIHITSMKQYRYRPVSARGIDYYLEYGTELIKEHHPVEALSVLKSICALKNDNNRIYQAQVKAAELIMKMRKNNGTRFVAMNESASLIIFQEDGGIKIINDQMMYSFMVPGRVAVLRKVDRSRMEYRYSGILFGILQGGGRSDGRDADAYDMLMAVDTEKFAVPYKNLAAAVDKWKGNIGYEGVTREVLEEDEHRYICSFRNRSEPRYGGIEGFFLEGTSSHYVRLVSSEGRLPELLAVMRKIIEGFRSVGRPGR